MQGSWKDRDKHIVKDKLVWLTNKVNRHTKLTVSKLEWLDYKYSRYGYYTPKSSKDLYSDKELKNFKGKINFTREDFVLEPKTSNFFHVEKSMRKPKFRLQDLRMSMYLETMIREMNYELRTLYDGGYDIETYDWKDYSDTDLGNYCAESGYYDTYETYEEYAGLPKKAPVDFKDRDIWADIKTELWIDDYLIENKQVLLALKEFEDNEKK